MAKNENERLPMASTTKVVTAIAVIENNDLTKTVTVPKAAVGVEGSSMYLKEGEKYTVKDLLCGLMLRSGNDCAVALALDTSGGIEEFAELMNGIASKLKLTNSHFVNPHGLPENNHYTSAYDLAIITAYALKNKEFSEIVKSKNYTLSNGNTIINKNKLLSSLEGCDGVKTNKCRIKVVDFSNNETKMEVVISEGKNRQIRRMFETLNREVVFLKRVCIGDLRLRGLNRGESRPLTEAEINYLKMV